MLRLTREVQLPAPQRQAVPAATQSHTVTITADRANPLWGIDRQGDCNDRRGLGVCAAAGLQFRNDPGSQFMSDDFQNEIRFLGIESSPAVVPEPEGNSSIEHFFKTLNGTTALGPPLPIDPGSGRGHWRLPCAYNPRCLIERHGFQSPVQAKLCLDLEPAA